MFEGLAQLLARSTPKPLCLVEFEPLGLAAMSSSAAELLDRFDRFGYAYFFVNWENIFPMDRSTLLQLASNWTRERIGGNLDLVLSPS